MHGDGRDGDAERSASPVVRSVEALAWAGGVIATLLVLVVLGLVTYAVSQRYFTGGPLTWADDLSSYLLVAFVALGVAEAFRRGDHIAIDLLADRLTGRGRRVLAVWSNLGVVVFGAVLTWSAWTQAKFAYDFGSFTIDRLEIQAWIPLVPLVVGGGLLTLLAAVRLVVAGWSGRQP